MAKIRSVKEALSRHFFTLMATPVVFGVPVLVSQVRSIIVQAWKSAVQGEGLPSAAFLLIGLVGSMFFLGSLFAVVPWEYRWLPRPPKTKPASFLQGCYWVADRATSVVQRLFGWMSQRKAFGLVLAPLGLLVLIGGAVASGSGWFPFAGAAAQNCALLFFLVGIVLMFFPSWLPPVSENKPEDAEKPAIAVSRVISWLVLCTFSGELIWLFGGWIFSYYPAYTLWAFAQVGFIILLLASLIDFLHEHSSYPIRWISLITAVVILCVSQFPLPIGRHDPSPPSTENIGAQWYGQLITRLKAMETRRLPGPAVIVVASGGGSRAAIFTSLVMDQLAREPMTIPSPGVDPANTAAGTTWNDHILLMSSVSGGSLATAYYVQREGSPSPIVAEMKTVSAEALRKSVDSSFTEWIGEMKDDDRALRDAAVKVRSRLKTTPLQFTEFFDAMGTDFMVPVLRGTLTPVLGRGKALSSFWSEQFSWGASSRLQGFGPDGGKASYDSGKYPTVLFNTTDADKGTRLIIGFPPLPEKLVRCDFELLSGRDRVPTEIETLDADLELTLGEAVRLSANFPWGFQIAKINLADGQSLHILDGGVVDNGGLDSVHYVIKGIQKASENDDAQAITLMNLLRQRGVLIMEIDSGAKPDHKPSHMPWAWATEPSRALTNSSYTNADLARDFHIKALQELLRPNPAAKQPNAAIADLSPVLWGLLKCNHSDPETDVMTAWALGPEHKASIIARFLVEWEQWDRRKLAEEAEILRKARNTVAAAAAIENIREQTAKVKADLTKPISDEERQQKTEELLKQLENQVAELHSARENADTGSSLYIDTALESLKAGEKALGNSRNKDPKEFLKAVNAWDIDAPSKVLTSSLDASQHRVRDLRQERQQAILKSSDFFLKQENAKK